MVVVEFSVYIILIFNLVHSYWGISFEKFASGHEASHIHSKKMLEFSAQIMSFGRLGVSAGISS